MRIYCTYFDHRYLTRGVLMHRSLRATGPVTTYVLCLDQLCFEMLRVLQEPGLEPVTMEQLERWAPELPALRNTRSLIEFYFTLTPFFTQYVLEKAANGELVTYIDSDLYFFAGPEPVFDEMRDSSIGIIGHKFAPECRDREAFGRYNVGFVVFRQDPEGRRCLQWWRDRCAEWCYDRPEPERFADQKYLDRWPALFQGVREIQHKGANVAPWNIANYSVTARNGAVRIDGADLLFFHFHALKQLSTFVLDTRLRHYAATLVPAVRHLIYAPYLQALFAIQRELDVKLAELSENAAKPLSREGSRVGVRERVRRARDFLTGAQRGDYVYVLGSRIV